MPLSPYQMALGRLLAANRSEDSYLAGGAAILAQPGSKRFSQDLDYFQDSAQRVAAAYEADKKLLIEQGYDVEEILLQPGYIQATVSYENQQTKIEWAHDSSWRFMPTVRSADFGYQLHPIDLATNKVLALAGREEPRDLIDTLFLHTTVLPLGPLVWAACGKDPGFSPQSLLELLKRRGKLHPEDLKRLHLVETPDLQQIKADWLAALESAATFIRSRPVEELGCLYYSKTQNKFVDPGTDADAVPHFGKPGGVLPVILAE